MKISAFAILLPLLGGCVYADSEHGRFAALDVPLPVTSRTTVQKTITVNAPPGTIVNISETPPPSVIYDRRPLRRCRYDSFEHRRVCDW